MHKDSNQDGVLNCKQKDKEKRTVYTLMCTHN